MRENKRLERFLFLSAKRETAGPCSRNKEARLRGLFGVLQNLGSGPKTWKWCPEEDSNLHALASAST